MGLFDRRLPQGARGAADRLEALEEYVEYLRQQGEYGLAQADRRLDALETRPRQG